MTNILISTQEAVKLSQYLTATDAAFAENIKEAFLTACKEKPFFTKEFVAGALFEAGRVQGIREERLKRKAV